MAAETIKLSLDSLHKAPPAPADLQAGGKAYWRHVTGTRVLDEEALDVLAVACRFLDRAAQAAARVKKDGAYLRSKQDILYPHPGVAVERASLQSFERCRRSLNLDGVPVHTELPKARRAAYR